MSGPLDKLEDKDREKLESGPPRFQKPMLAMLTHDRFSDDRWIFERKLDGDLVFAGRVGTGFDDETLCRLHRKLRRRERKTSPFKRQEIVSSDKIHWATPRLVCEIGFTEWTPNGKLRHPRFLGLRRDKDPAEVIREDQ